MSNRIILSSSECGYSWIEQAPPYTGPFGYTYVGWVGGFTPWVDFDLDANPDVIVIARASKAAAAEHANAAFVVHHSREMENEPFGWPESDGQLSFWSRRNPFTILRNWMEW